MSEARARYRSIMCDSARWDGFEFRPDDVVISTPPKCGTTWMQMQCALLILQTPDLPARLTELSPWIDIATAKAEDVRAQLDAQTHRRFIKSHTPLDGLPQDPDVTYVCVGRDPRDVAVSWDNHFMNMNLPVIIGARSDAVGLDDLAEFFPDGIPEIPDDPVERIRQWIDDDTPPQANLSTLRATLHHLSSFWDRRDDDNVVLFHYADMQRDLDREMRRLADALHVDVPADRWDSLVEAAMFSEMKSRADQLAPQTSIDNFWNDTDKFFNTGASGQWESLFPPDLQARYAERVQELAAPDVVAWAETGWGL